MKGHRRECLLLPPLNPGLVKFGDPILALKTNGQSVEHGVVACLNDLDGIGVRIFDTALDTIYVVPNELCRVSAQPRMVRVKRMP